jgi:hypothetical protein
LPKPLAACLALLGQTSNLLLHTSLVEGHRATEPNKEIPTLTFPGWLLEQQHPPESTTTTTTPPPLGISLPWC